MKVNQGVLLSRPKDKSHDVLKTWMQELTKHLTGREKSDGTITEEEWIQYTKILG